MLSYNGFRPSATGRLVDCWACWALPASLWLKSVRQEYPYISHLLQERQFHILSTDHQHDVVKVDSSELSCVQCKFSGKFYQSHWQ